MTSDPKLPDTIAELRVENERLQKLVHAYYSFASLYRNELENYRTWAIFGLFAAFLEFGALLYIRVR